ncbi:hypothetical protein [Allonocardiopsis opalescens]|uniref:Uncharacterized protein n=1 Tax=Allonocardiopsis opalescens TaxID=1144618 RepID=A0A2T0Q6G8_9ACTN|nr:hypothetical protein [Allonocardiopsis opalescens]PRX99408.1 hypothetical protein CLV72_1034 [Allonocardiopsis opalescens]
MNDRPGGGAGRGRRLSEWWRAQRMEAVNTDLAPGWYRTRARRRALAAASVALTLAGAAVILVLEFADAGGPAVWALLAALVTVVLLQCATFSLLNIGTRGLTGLPERSLDERQLAERNRAGSLAHRISTVLLFGAFLGLCAGLAVSGGNGTAVPPGTAIAAMYLLAMVHMQLPAVVAAWRLPDAPVDEDADD